VLVVRHQHPKPQVMMVQTLFFLLLPQRAVVVVVFTILVLAQGVLVVLAVVVRQLVLVEEPQVLAQAVKDLLAVLDLAHPHLQAVEEAVLALLVLEQHLV